MCAQPHDTTRSFLIVSMVPSGWKEGPLNTVICMSQLLIGCKFPSPYHWHQSFDFYSPSNGMVSLAFQLEDERLLGQVKSFLDWTLDHQGKDGWIGPEPFVANATVPRLVWPRYLMLLGLIVCRLSRSISATIAYKKPAICRGRSHSNRTNFGLYA